jgi:ribokinase
VVALVAGQTLRVPAFRVEAVDTVAAGDCFVGYLLASLDAGSSWPKSLERACAAAAISVSRNGAMASIPTLDEVDTLLARSTKSSARAPG